MSLGGVGHFFTSRAVNSYPIDKPFEMGTYLELIERSIFLYDHWMSQTLDFGPLLTKLLKFLEVALRQSHLKKVEKNQKIMKIFFSPKMFLICSNSFQSVPKMFLRRRTCFFTTSHLFNVLFYIYEFLISVTCA